jgi:alcohol dehydrogenase
MTSCGTCDYCREGLTSHCLAVGGDSWQLGHWLWGTQAEYVRLPYAETSTFRFPEGITNSQAVMTSDILSTGYEIGVVKGKVSPGKSVVVIGTGPVGMAAILTSHLRGPKYVIAVDRDSNRLLRAISDFGATHAVNSADPDWKQQIHAIVGPDGADVIMEAVGIPETLEAAFDLVRPGGNIANIGVHGAPVSNPMERMWTRNITLTTGLVPMTTGQMMLDMIAAGKLNVKPMATHNFKLDDFIEAYDVFEHAAKTQALKLAINK